MVKNNDREKEFCKYLNYLNENIKNAPPKASKCTVISENNFCKVEFHSVIPVYETKSIISERERRKACCCVQFPVGHGKLRSVGCYIVVCINIVVHEVSSAAKCPVLT